MQDIDAAGLSLNFICQQCSDHMLRDLLKSGTRIRCLFLQPSGEAMTGREREEGYPIGHLPGLTAMNIQILFKAGLDRNSSRTLSLGWR